MRDQLRRVSPGFAARVILLALSTAVLAGRAEEPLLLTQARRARAEAVPQVAIQKLRTLLAAKDLAPAVRDACTRELAASLLAAGETEEALWLVEPLARTGETDARLLQASLLATAGRWTEARPLYEALSRAAEAPPAAKLGLAASWQALGETTRAIEVLDAFLREHPAHHAATLRLVGLLAETKNLKRGRALLARVQPESAAEELWKKYLAARLLLIGGQPQPALALAEELLQNPQSCPANILAGAALAAAEALSALKGPDAADTPLEKFIWQNPASPHLDLAFQRLNQIYAEQKHPSEAELKKWTQKSQSGRAALAQYYLARMLVRAKRTERAAETLDALIKDHPATPLLLRAHLFRADLFLEKSDFAAVVREMEAALREARTVEDRAPIEMRMALIHYRQGEWLLAENSFRRVAEWSGPLRENATFDAALAGLRLKNEDRFSEGYRALTAAFPSSPLRGELLLEQGLTQARDADARAAETLEHFLHQFPQHARQSEARLALAELAFQDANAAGATRLLRVANETAPTPAMSAHAAYLAIFLADAAPHAEEKVIAQGEKFLRDFAGTPLVSEVRMKLGEVYFRMGDHANAETQFTLLAREFPDGAYAETALFLAGQSAMRMISSGTVDRALALFDEVVNRAGPLKLYARQQQAIVQTKIGREAEAIVIDDAILSAQPPPELELRFAALCGKGDNLAALGRRDPAQSTTAITIFEQLAAWPAVTAFWRNQALYKKGKVLEQLARVPEALATYYDVLDLSAADGQEIFWFYKAGFDAALLFERQEQWKSAIGIYEKMAKVDGPRRDEALARVKQLRLEKFIWE